MARKLAKLSYAGDNSARRRGVIGTCADCGTRFRTPDPWRPRRCRGCFRALKAREEAEARRDAYDAGWNCAYVAGWDDAGWDSGYRSGRLSALNEELLHDLIRLCHPDRHIGCVDLATRVMGQLLELREQTRRAA